MITENSNMAEAYRADYTQPSVLKINFYTKILNIRKQKPYLYYPMVVFITGPKIS